MASVVALRHRSLSRWMAGTAAALCCAAALAASPGLHEVYQAAEAGHVEQAQQMMDQVLREHPDSAKAYYVRAELYARQGRTALAQQALAQAERLQPGLPFAGASAVRALRELLAEQSAAPSRARGPATAADALPREPAGSLGGGMFPWLAAAGLALAAWIMWRLRPRPEPKGGVPMSGSAGTYAPGGMPGYAPSSPYPAAAASAPSGGGLGAGIAGGLATGVAVGAGAVAGQMLMQRVLGGGDHAASSSGLFTPSAADRGDLAGTLGDPMAADRLANDDMGGADFGVADAGSWDDGGGGGGSDDWT